MSSHYILQIETATQVCSVALAVNGETLVFRDVNEPNVHASMLTRLIAEILREAGVGFGDLSAVAVSKGPGSYTGLRIGVSTAKGLCYAADLPLIGVDTLRGMAAGFGAVHPEVSEPYTRLYPMIDARRMEVYMAAYNPALQLIQPVSAVVMDAQTFGTLDADERIVLFGSGADKLHALYSDHRQIDVIQGFLNSARYFSCQAYQAFLSNEFEDVAYMEPFYLKDFVATKPKASPSA